MPTYERHEEVIGGLRSISIEEVPTPAEAAAQAALDAKRAILRQQLDPNQPDPTTKQLADAQAFVALAADIGIAETAAVAGADIAVEEKA